MLILQVVSHDTADSCHAEGSFQNVVELNPVKDGQNIGKYLFDAAQFNSVTNW